MILWTIPQLQSKKECNDAIIGSGIKLNFSIILYIINGLTVFSMIYAPCLLSIPENEKKKEEFKEEKIYDNVKEEEQKHNFKEKTVINIPKDDKEMDDFL